MDHKEANLLFQKKRKIGEDTINLERNMTMRKVNKSFIIYLYSTPIVTILPNGLFRLSANKRLTNLTKARMEKYSPVKLKQIDGWWWIVDQKEKILSLYYERILVDKNGKPTIKISEKSTIFKRTILLLDKMIDQLSDYKIQNIFGKTLPKGQINNLLQLLESSSKDIKSIYWSYSKRDLSLQMDKFIHSMLKSGGIYNYSIWENMKTNIFKSHEKLLRAYFIPYIASLLKFVLKNKEKVNA